MAALTAKDNENGGVELMKITTADGMVFEGTMAEYMEFLAFAERKVTEGEAPYEPQVGDIVVVTANTVASANEIGDIGKVGEEKALWDGGVCVYVPGGPTTGIRTLPEEIRPATAEEVAAYEKAQAEASKPKLKAGDFVKIVSGDEYFTNQPYEVFEDSDRDLYVMDDDGDKCYHVLEDGDYEIVDAETAKWAKLGRKVGEYKKGDIVRVSTRADAHKCAGNLVTIAEFRLTDKCGGLAWFEDYGHSITGQYLELIAPVESLFTQN